MKYNLSTKERCIGKIKRLKSDILDFSECYLPIIFSIVTGFIALYCSSKYSNIDEINKWIGTSSLPFQISIVIMPFILTAKGIIITLDTDKYNIFNILSQVKNRGIKNNFYKYMDKTIYSSCFVIVLNLLYIFILPLLNTKYAINRYAVSFLVGITFYMVLSLAKILRCLYLIQKERL